MPRKAAVLLHGSGQDHEVHLSFVVLGAEVTEQADLVGVILRSDLMMRIQNRVALASANERIEEKVYGRR